MNSVLKHEGVDDIQVTTCLSLDYNSNSATFIHRHFIFLSPTKAPRKIDLNDYITSAF